MSAALREFLARANDAPSAATVRGLALEFLAKEIGFDSAVCFPLDERLGGPMAINKPRVDNYHQLYCSNRARYAQSLLKGNLAARAQGGVFHDLDVYSARERDRLPFFADIVRPQGVRGRLVAYLSFRGQFQTVIHLCRHQQTLPFADHAQRALREFLPGLNLAQAAHMTTAGPTLATASLTPREREIAEYVALGFRNQDIAFVLQTSPRTVRNQLYQLFRKVGVANRAELAVQLTRQRS